MEGNKFNFKNLAPSKVANMEAYKQALDYAFSNFKIGNIAITGNYGAGKSSVIETYEESTKDKKYIHVSLANFIAIDEEDLEDSNKRIEAHIINQIIHQINPDYIAETSFKIKNRGKKKRNINILGIIMLNLLILSSFALWKIEDIFSVIKFLNPDINKNIIMLIMLIMFAGSLICFISLICFSQLKHNTIKKINYNGSEIELFDKETDSVLDKNLDEFIYILKESDVDAFIFEDLDRYNNINIFSKLREINFLSNNQNNRKKTIKFIYLVKDDMFKANDRTKFFEFIIPIIPVIDINNSKDKMLELFNGKILVENDINKRFIDKISYYIDDMRIMTNIYNEFLIYATQIKKVERNLLGEKLLAIITYKNIFPDDFAKLQKNEGYVSNIFEKKQRYIESKILLLEEKIENNKKIISELEISIENSEVELIAIFLNGQGIYYLDNVISNKDIAQKIIQMNDNENIYFQYRGGSYNKTKANILSELEQNHEFVRRRENLGNQLKKDRIDYLKSQIKNLEIEIIEIKNKNIFEIIQGLENIFEFSDDEFSYIKQNSKYIGLIRMLILEGYLDEMHLEYMGYFYPNSLTIKDQNFKVSVFEGRNLEYKYKLTKVKLLLEIFEESDFTREAILNYDLLDEMLISKKDNLLLNLIDNILKRDNLKFIQGYFEEGKYFKIFIEYFNSKFGSSSKMFLADNRLTKEFKNEYVKITLLNSKEYFEKINIENKLSDYLEEDIAIFSNLETENEAIFIESLVKLNVKLQDLNVYNNISIDSINKIVKNKIYKLCMENIIYLICKLMDSYNEKELYIKNYSILNSNEKLKKILEYVNENMEEYIELNLKALKENEILINETIDTLKLVNEISSLELKENLIKASNIKVPKINSIDSDLWKLLVESNKVQSSYYNVLKYIEKNDLTDEIIDFINSFKEENFEEIFNYKEINSDELESLEEKIILSRQIKISVYKKICEKINWKFIDFNASNLSNDQVETLIKVDIIEMNSNNYNEICQNYKEALISFIHKNLNEFNELIINEIYLDKNILIKILNSDDFNFEEKISILNIYDELVSLKDISEDRWDIKIFILENNFDVDDVEYLINNYSKFINSLFKEKIILKLVDFIENIDFEAKDYIFILDFIKNRKIEKNLKYELLIKFINYDLSINNKLGLIIEVMPILNIDEIENIFEELKIQEFIDLFKNKYPKFEKSVQIKELLDILKEKEIISSIKDDGFYYKVFSKKNINRVISGT